jgi:hypothetical protein
MPLTPNTIPVDRIRIFAKDGSEIAQFSARVERSWAIADEGRAQFAYPSRKTDVVNERVLQFGNWILIENSVIPSWVGVIDTPRTWDARYVTISCYSPERVFSWRRGPTEIVINASAGAIFESLIYYVNLAERTPLTAGNIWKGGTQRQETLNPTALNEDLKRVQERSAEEYAWRPIVDNGKLIVYADWTEKLGIDTSALLHEGKFGGNVEKASRILVEDAPILNDILGYGQGETWKTRPTALVFDAESASKYGLRQKAIEYNGVSSNQTLLDNSQTELNKTKNPSRRFALNALNVGDTFAYLQLGNRLNLQFQNIGFYNGDVGYETRVRITGMSYDPSSKNELKLIVQEIV